MGVVNNCFIGKNGNSKTPKENNCFNKQPKEYPKSHFYIGTSPKSSFPPKVSGWMALFNVIIKYERSVSLGRTAPSRKNH